MISPKPWKWTMHFYMTECYTLDDKDGNRVCDDGSANGEYGPAIDVEGDDARLIEAAPDLLDALKKVEWVADEYEDWCPWCHQNRDRGHTQDCIRQLAISKAEGKR